MMDDGIICLCMHNTAESDFVSFILLYARPMYNVRTAAIGRPNETIYYGRAGKVLKKKKKFPRPIHVQQYYSRAARGVINPIMLLC